MNFDLNIWNKSVKMGQVIQKKHHKLLPKGPGFCLDDLKGPRAMSGRAHRRGEN
jgi:hypothetical protein